MLDRGEYGRMFPASMSFSYFPESGPLYYEGAEISDWEKVGMRKFDITDGGAFGEQRMEGREVRALDQLPDDIQDIEREDWAGKPIADPEIRRPYALLRPEIAFYKKHNLAAPRKHFTSRVRDLQWCSNIGILDESTCAKCGKHIWLARNRTFTKRKVYCLECYLNYLQTR
jgi:hypothetical protein